jgi:hypothetical protein
LKHIVRLPFAITAYGMYTCVCFFLWNVKEYLWLWIKFSSGPEYEDSFLIPVKFGVTSSHAFMSSNVEIPMSICSSLSLQFIVIVVIIGI